MDFKNNFEHVIYYKTSQYKWIIGFLVVISFIIYSFYSFGVIPLTPYQLFIIHGGIGVLVLRSILLWVKQKNKILFGLNNKWLFYDKEGWIIWNDIKSFEISSVVIGRNSSKTLKITLHEGAEVLKKMGKVKQFYYLINASFFGYEPHSFPPLFEKIVPVKLEKLVRLFETYRINFGLSPKVKIKNLANKKQTNY